MARKDEAPSLEMVREYLDRRLPGFDGIDEISEEVSETSWALLHKADPEDASLRKAVLKIAEGAAQAEAAALGKAVHAAGAATAVRKRESPLGIALSAKARLDLGVSEFLRQEPRFVRVPGLGTEERLRLIAAHELIHNCPRIPKLRELLARRTLEICEEHTTDLRHASLVAAWELLRLPIQRHLPCLGRIQLDSLNQGETTIPYFEPRGILERLHRLPDSLSQDYGLHQPDVLDLILNGKPARLQGAAVRLEEHARFRILDRIILTVPAHIEPSEVAALYARARSADKRPRGLGAKNIALVSRWAKRCLEDGVLCSWDELMEEWNSDSGLPRLWRFAARYRFNDALRRALDRILRPTPAERSRTLKAELIGEDVGAEP